MFTTPTSLLIRPADEAKKLLDDAEDEAPGHTVAFIDGKSIIVGQPRGMRSASAKTDWLDVHETDIHAECSEDDADDNDDRPAEPGTQQLHGPPLYALPAYRESGQGNRFASNWTHLKESVLNHRNMQARVTRDCLDDPGQAMKEMQNEESAQYIEQDVLTMTQDLDVNKEFKEGPTNAMNPNEMNKEPID